MPEETNYIDRADKAGDIARKHVGWMERYIQLLIIIWLASWMVYQNAQYQKERGKMIQVLLKVIEYQAIPNVEKNIQTKDSLYKEIVKDAL